MLATEYFVRFIIGCAHSKNQCMEGRKGYSTRETVTHCKGSNFKKIQSSVLHHFLKFVFQFICDNQTGLLDLATADNRKHA
jgi:hypothetical protein